MNILITGGAGFIGSHVIDYLLSEGHKVICVDDLSLGKKENIMVHEKNHLFTFICMDILNQKQLSAIFKDQGVQCVFHFAANADIRGSITNLHLDLEKTFLTTFSVLECMKENNVKQIVFPSSSAIYGEREGLLNEETGLLFPISFYGAAKLSSEAYISAFCSNYDAKAWILRFPNVVGARATHGVVYDFIKRLKQNDLKLFVFGDGTQEKPYVHVQDLVQGIIAVWKKTDSTINCFNVGVESTTTVKRIAEMVIEEMKLKKVKIEYSGGKRGWQGDIPKFQYSLSKIHALGWKASLDSDSAVRKAIEELLLSQDMGSLKEI